MPDLRFIINSVLVMMGGCISHRITDLYFFYVTVTVGSVSVVGCKNCMTPWQQETTSEQQLLPSGTASSTRLNIPQMVLESWSLLELDADKAMCVVLSQYTHKYSYTQTGWANVTLSNWHRQRLKLFFCS